MSTFVDHVVRDEMRPDELCDRLSRAGFRVVRRSPGHVLMANDRRRVIVPADVPVLHGWVQRTIEWELEGELGVGWLRRRDPDDPDRVARGHEAGDEPLRLHMVLERHDDGWCGFVVEQYEILSCGASDREVAGRLREAAALWFARPESLIELRRVGDAP